MTSENNIAAFREESIFPLLVRYSLPAIVGTTAASVYNVIDRIIIGNGVNAMAISGLALTFPLMNLSVALGALVGVGASTMTSIRLGERQNEEAVRILCNSLVLNILIGVLYGAVSLLFLDEILYAFGASEQTLPYAREFMQVTLLGNAITHVYLGLNNVMRVCGYPQKAMYITLFTVAVNLVLAPLFIYCFHWGIRGAALATVLAQLMGMLVVLLHFAKTSAGGIRFHRYGFKMEWRIFRDILSIGLSPFAMHICLALVVIVMNRSLKVYGGDMAIGAYGIVNSVIGLFAMIVIGLNQGMQPIVGYNYGARIYSRVFKAYWLTVAAATILVVVGFVGVSVFPYQIARAFTDDAELLALAKRGLRLTVLVFPCVGIQMVTSNFFQAIGKAHLSIFLSMSRQMLFLIPSLLILPRICGLDGVWLSAPVSDFTAFMLTMIVLRFQVRKMKREERDYGFEQ